MGDKNPIRTLEDYSKPSHEGYRKTIELLEGNNVVPLRSDTILFVQNQMHHSYEYCSFEVDSNQHLKDLLKLVDSLDLDVANREEHEVDKTPTLTGRRSDDESQANGCKGECLKNKEEEQHGISSPLR
ncbi:hypothetical protein Tco_0127864 [Tanacetum coccineum]